MKVWQSYGSEHSMNLVMIGAFEDSADAAKAKRILDELILKVSAAQEAGDIEFGEDPGRTPEAMYEYFKEISLYTVSPGELQQFLQDVRVREDDKKVVITTDEIDVSAFLKVLLDLGGRVEVYSAHAHSGTGYGRNMAQ
jgi:hypothetical protein